MASCRSTRTAAQGLSFNCKRAHRIDILTPSSLHYTSHLNFRRFPQLMYKLIFLKSYIYTKQKSFVSKRMQERLMRSY